MCYLMVIYYTLQCRFVNSFLKLFSFFYFLLIICITV
nr:MAG TPA: hypothetical protein [Caudoviricetes sp.]